MVAHADEIISWARARIGIREHPLGSNNGPALREMLRNTNFAPGNAWCMFFAEAAIKQAFHPQEAMPPWIVHTGSCADQAHAAALVSKTSEWPATGCIVLYRGGPRGFHHAGIVTNVEQGGKVFNTIEGNSNPAGGVTGGEVCEHVRTRTDEVFVIW